jgi:hypothetical protein
VVNGIKEIIEFPTFTPTQLKGSLIQAQIEIPFDHDVVPEFVPKNTPEKDIAELHFHNFEYLSRQILAVSLLELCFDFPHLFLSEKLAIGLRNAKVEIKVK